ncbi:hypothetical protein [Paraburkholderia tropica]|uniref:hypothetical protein n=1 Tax=Paraburkholderia tropica TaxID=92647 RepID=UPI00161F48C0|nr:hypothetical protein [Paraburkholderia tropica]MBB6320563.1 hypothetical protein [Paraburkholderia tropica]
MKIDITDFLLAPALIALMSEDSVSYGPSWLRTAASSYRADRTRVTRGEFERRWAVDGEVIVLTGGDDFRFVDPTEFDKFHDQMLDQIARTFR